jgi:hypothetical protein
VTILFYFCILKQVKRSLYCQGKKTSNNRAIQG